MFKNIQAENNALIRGTLGVNEDLLVKGNLTVERDLILNEDVKIKGYSLFQDNVKIDGNLSYDPIFYNHTYNANIQLVSDLILNFNTESVANSNVTNLVLNDSSNEQNATSITIKTGDIIYINDNFYKVNTDLVHTNYKIVINGNHNFENKRLMVIYKNTPILFSSSHNEISGNISDIENYPTSYLPIFLPPIKQKVSPIPSITQQIQNNIDDDYTPPEPFNSQFMFLVNKLNSNYDLMLLCDYNDDLNGDERFIDLWSINEKNKSVSIINFISNNSSTDITEGQSWYIKT